MSFRILLPLVPFVVPLAARWVRGQETAILAAGCRLSAQELCDARRAGVAHPEEVRLQFVPAIPLPASPILLYLGRWTGLVSPHTSGITLRYGIYIRRDCRSDRSLLLHELVHVGQYERLGSIGAFLRMYLRECLDPGYPFGPLEQEAMLRAQELLDSDV